MPRGMRSQVVAIVVCGVLGVAACGSDDAVPNGEPLPPGDTYHPSATAPAGPGQLFVYVTPHGSVENDEERFAGIVDVATGDGTALALPPIDERAIVSAATGAGDSILLTALRCDETLGSDSEECRPGTYEAAVLELDAQGGGSWTSLDIPDGLTGTESLWNQPLGALDDHRVVLRAGDGHWLVDLESGSIDEVAPPPPHAERWSSCVAANRLVLVESADIVDDGTPPTSAALTPGAPPADPATSTGAWWTDPATGTSWDPLPPIEPGLQSVRLACTDTHALAWDGPLASLRAMPIEDPTSWAVVPPPDPGAFAWDTASQVGEIFFDGSPGPSWRLDPSGPTWTPVDLSDHGIDYTTIRYWVDDHLVGWAATFVGESRESEMFGIEMTAPG